MMTVSVPLSNCLLCLLTQAMKQPEARLLERTNGLLVPKQARMRRCNTHEKKAKVQASLPTPAHFARGA